MAVCGVSAAAPTKGSPGSDTNGRAPVAVGLSPASLPGASVFGNTPPDVPETVSFVLKGRNLPDLANRVEQGLSSFVSVNQFAAVYGQSPQLISQLEAYLGGFGITTSAYPDGLAVVANGMAGAFDRALSVQQHQYYVPAVPARPGVRAIPAQTVHGTAQSPQLPSGISQSVLAVLGLTNYSAMAGQAVHAPNVQNRPDAGGAASCLSLTGISGDCNLPSDFASHYGLGGLHQQGAALGLARPWALSPSPRSIRGGAILLAQRFSHTGDRPDSDDGERRRRFWAPQC